MAIDVGDGFVELGLDTGSFDKKLDATTKRFGGSLDKWKKGMKIAGAAIAGAAIGIGTVSLKMAADFDGAMREVNTMMLLNEEEFKGLSAEVRQLSADMGVNAVDSANALYQAISAGVPKENAIEFLAVATRAAIGGVTDTQTAVDGLSTVLNAFKIPVNEAERVADLMFTTVKGGKTTFEELSASLFQVAPMAATAGVSFDTVSAALATMTKQGVPTNVATTQLRQSIQAMIKPTADMKSALDTLGYASGEAMLAELGFQGSLDALKESTNGNNETLGKMFGSVEGLQAVFALTGENAAMFTADLAAMENATGASTDAFNEMEKSTGRQFEALKAQFADVAMSIGVNLLPMLTTLLEAVKPILDTVGAWVKEHPKLTMAILAGMAVFGTLLATIGPILSLITGITAALPFLGVAFTVATGPVGLIIAAVAGLIAVGVLVYKNWDTIKAKAVQIWGGLKTFFGWIGAGVKAIFMNMTPLGFIIGNWQTISKFATKIFGGVVKVFQAIPGKIGRAFSTLANIMLAPFRLYVKGMEAAINWIIRQLNKISINIPDWVPLIGGRHFGFNIPTISLPHFAEGGMITEPTLLYGLRSKRPYAIAGEAGPEAVVPGGGGGGGATVNMYGPWHVRDDSDIHKIGQAVAVELEKIMGTNANLRGAY